MIKPNKLMFRIWTFCSFLWFFLPFQLLKTDFSNFGFVVLIAFILFFILGGQLANKSKMSSFKNYSYDVKFSLSIIALISIIATVFLIFESQGKLTISLADAYISRSNAAQGLLYGDVSNSSIYFKVAFLTYPAGYVYLALGILFLKKINFFKLTLFGLLPISLSAFAMGGRVQLFYAILVIFLSLSLRKKYWEILGVEKLNKFRWTIKKMFIALILFTTLIVTSIYFVNVFFARAESVGGSEGMFKVAETIWGIGFRGALSNFLFEIFSIDIIFIVFMFSWYLSQGLVMSNIIFEGYDGPLQLGVYGVEIISAIVRRFDGTIIYNNFQSLMDLGTYGFLPSAFGSLFIDFHFFGLIISFLWGWWSTKVYRKTINLSVKSMLLYPFMIIGIILSIINTPIGMTNGLITFFWLFTAYFFIKKQKTI